MVLPPLLVRVLDQSSYATWMLLLQVSAYITLIENSIDRVTMRFVARARGLGDNDYMGKMVSSAGVVLLAGAMLGTLLCIVISWKLPVLFRSVPSDILPDAKRALLITGCSIAAALPFSVYSGIFRGYQRNEIPAIGTTVGKVLGTIGVAWAAWHRQGLTAMALWTAVGTVFTRAIYVVVWRRWPMKNLIHIARVRTAAMREFLSIWSAMTAAQLCGILITGLDLPIVAAFDFSAAAYYAVAATLTSLLLVPQSSILDAVLPAMSSLSANSPPDRVGGVAIRLTRYANAISFLIALPLLFGMQPFLRVWVTEKYAVHVLPLAVVLVVAQMVRSCVSPYVMTAFSAGQQKQTLISPFIEGPVNLVVSLLLVRRIGALGVALGTLLGAVVGVIVHLTVSMRLTDALRMSRLDFLGEGILRPLICVLPALALLLVFQWLHPPVTVHLLAVAAGEAIAAGGLLLGNFKAAERAQFVGWGRRCVTSLTSGFA